MRVPIVSLTILKFNRLMDDAAHYRDSAERYRQLAASAPLTETKARWLKLAMENQLLADAISRVPTIPREESATSADSR